MPLHCGRSLNDGSGVNQQMRDLFGPRSYKGGRVQVWGCSPGCLILSIVVSVVLTIALNLAIRAF